MKENGIKKEMRQISDPYLSAYLFLTLKIKPDPVIDNTGRVAFEFPENEQLEKAISSFYRDIQVSAFTYSGAIKAVKSIIFAMKSKVRR